MKVKENNFLTSLAFSGDEEVFEVDVINNVIHYMWKFYRRAIVYNILLPFIVYFTVFIIYATWINKKKDEENDKTGTYAIVNYGMSGVLILLILYFLVFELKKLYYYKFRYFLNFWNLIDVISIILNTTIIAMDIFGQSERDRVPMLACSVIFMWLKL